jgi:hypothetical protein
MARQKKKTQSNENSLTVAYNFITGVADKFRERVSFDMGITPESYMRLAKRQTDGGYNVLDNTSDEIVIDNLKRVISEAQRALDRIESNY